MRQGKAQAPGLKREKNADKRFVDMLFPEIFDTVFTRRALRRARIATHRAVGS
jgi:hypothetical protein